MTQNDISVILARLDDMVQRLVRIETRTESVADHERRIWALEVAHAQAGKFTLGVLGRFLVGVGGFLVVGASVAATVHGW